MSPWSHGSRSARNADDDLLTTVIGHHGAPYRCPDLASVDGYIVELYQRIGYVSSRFPHLVDEFWADIDLLLDRRMWLAHGPGIHAPA
jgi:hypothetical protein